MAPALVLSAFLSLPATLARPAAVFQPRLAVKFLPLRTPAVQQHDADREVICGMVVIHKTPADDPKIVLPPRATGAVIRRIGPQVCGATAGLIGK